MIKSTFPTNSIIYALEKTKATSIKAVHEKSHSTQSFLIFSWILQHLTPPFQLSNSFATMHEKAKEWSLTQARLKTFNILNTLKTNFNSSSFSKHQKLNFFPVSNSVENPYYSILIKAHWRNIIRSQFNKMSVFYWMNIFHEKLKNFIIAILVWIKSNFNMWCLVIT